MREIFPETHKRISSQLADKIEDIYGIELNRKKLLFGSVEPDIRLKYKFKRHYAHESLDFVVGEIKALINVSKFLDFDSPLFKEIYGAMFARRLGVISHYLCDFVTKPHYQRWTFKKAPIKHIKYESNLNDLATYYVAQNIPLKSLDFQMEASSDIRIEDLIKNYLLMVLEEYSNFDGFGLKVDLDFAYSLNLRVSIFIVEMVKAYSTNTVIQEAFALG